MRATAKDVGPFGCGISRTAQLRRGGAAAAVALGLAVLACSGGGSGGGAGTHSISGNVSGISTSVGLALTGPSCPSGCGTSTDGGGNYMFSNLANGTYTIVVDKADCTIWPLAHVVGVSGADVIGQDFSITYSISGIVWKLGGAAHGLEFVTVSLTGSSSDSTTTDASGNYVFTGLSNGSYTVTPTMTGYTFNPTSDSISVGDGNATVPAFFSPPAGSCWYSSGGYSYCESYYGADYTDSTAESDCTSLSGTYYGGGVVNCNAGPGSPVGACIFDGGTSAEIVLYYWSGTTSEDSAACTGGGGTWWTP